MPKIICTICENDNFENIDGFYYCIVCGNQSKVSVFYKFYFQNFFKFFLKNVCDIELSDEELAVNGNENFSSPVKEAKYRQKEDNNIGST